MAADIKTRDTVNSLLNYDVSDNEDDPFREIDTTIHEPDDRPNGTKRKAPGSDNKENADALGLDDEVKIVKKRKPVVKLDEARLLSQPGIPKLHAIARTCAIASKLRLKGKGHEYSDAAKLLSYYQLWLDNLYPKARFADGLQLVEKVGHGKRMQVMRKQWIDEGKPGYRDEAEDRFEKLDGGKGLVEGIETESNDKQPEAGSNDKAHDSIFGNLDEGEDDDLFFADATGAATHNPDDLNEPDEDELDALLAEQTANHNVQPHNKPPVPIEDEEDDLNALLAEQTARHSPIEKPGQQEPKTATLHEEDDLDAVLAENEAKQLPPPEIKLPERNELPVEDEDELEVLLAEQASEAK
jgi:replication fork protection complex subunit Csm3/Swi3